MSELTYNLNNLYNPTTAFKEAKRIIGCGDMALGYVESEDTPYLSPGSAVVWKKISTGEEVLLKRRQYDDPHIAIKFTT